MRKVVDFAVVLLILGLLFTAFPEAVKASSSWEEEWVQDSYSDFQGGSLENVLITGPGDIHLPVAGRVGNEFVIDDDRTDATKLTSSDDRVSMRFTAQNSKKLVRVEVRVYQTGDAMTWRLRIESDNNGEPSGNLAWSRSKGSAFIDGSGRISVDLNSSGSVVKGRIYHIVIEPDGIPDGGNYINPHSLSPLNEYRIGRTPTNGNLDTLISSDGGNSWTELGREPVYVLSFYDGTGEGNPYYSAADQVVYGGHFPGDEGSSVGQILSPGETMGGTVDNLTSIGFYVTRTGAPDDNLYFWLYDLTDSKYLVENLVLAENSISDESFTWQDASFSPIDLEDGREYLAYLTSPGSDSENNFEVKSLHSYAGDPWPSVTYGAENSVFVSSQVSGDISVDEDVYGLGGAMFESSGSYDLSFRLGLDYKIEKGFYISPVIDAAEEWGADSIVGWDNILWSSITPGNTSIEVQTRSGDSAVPDFSWSSWEPVSNADDIPSPNSRYLQYRVKLHSKNKDHTPTLRNVIIKVEDVLKPAARDLTPFDGEIITDNLPTISASLSDDFSGIDSDKVRMWINGTEVLPVYDEVTREVRYQTFESFEGGEVEVNLKVSDEGGKTLTKDWSFYVRPTATTVHHSEPEDFSRGEVDGIDVNSGSMELDFTTIGNLLANPSFEERGADNTYYWTHSTTNTERSTDEARTGDWAMWMGELASSYDGREVTLENFEVDAEREYIFGAWYYLDETGGSPDDYTHFVQIEWLDENKDQIGDGFPESGNVFKTFGEWTEIEHIAEAPADAAYARMIIRARHDGDESTDVYWDDAFFTSPELTYGENGYLGGSFVSPKIDAGGRVEWGKVGWNASVPENTSFKVETRLSNDGSTWTDWRVLTEHEPIPGSVSRYLQYKVELATSDYETTPSLDEINFAGKDAVPPTISNLYPSDGNATKKTHPVISAGISDDLAGIDEKSLVIELDNRAIDSQVPSFESGEIEFVPFDGLREGVHSIRMSVSDKCGNRTSKAWNFIVDITVPSVAITSPASGHETRSAEITLEGTVDDPTATVTVNGVEAIVSGTDFEATVELTGGRNTVVATATDAAGNVSQDSIVIERNFPSSTLLFWSTGLGVVLGVVIILVMGFAGGVLRK